MSRRPTAIDLFSGAGGFSFGCEQAGFDVVLGADREPDNVSVHADMFSYGRHAVLDLSSDQTPAIRRLTGLAEGEPDIVTMSVPSDCVVVGGPPCQGISAMGRRDPDDVRNDLMGSYVDHVIRLGASYAVMEQVPTILQERNAGILDGLRERLHRGGYSLVEPRTLSAVDFGVPQRRTRAFLLIHRNDRRAPNYPMPTHGTGDLLLRPAVTVAEAFDGLPDADAFEELWDRDWVRTGHPWPVTRHGRLMRRIENDPEDFSHARDWDPDLLTCSQRTRHEDASVARFRTVEPGGSERTSRRHRLDPDGFSLTLRAGTDSTRGSFTSVVPIHPKGTRVVTPRECARLHGYFDGFRFSRTKIKAYRMIGNSVCPPVGRAVAREIAKAMGYVPVASSELVRLGRPEDGISRQAA